MSSGLAYQHLKLVDQPISPRQVRVTQLVETSDDDVSFDVISLLEVTFFETLASHVERRVQLTSRAWG
jgi:hypothetical protein